MLIVAFVSFSLFNFVGDPVHNMVGQEASMEKREEIREKLHLEAKKYIEIGEIKEAWKCLLIDKLNRNI